VPRETLDLRRKKKPVRPFPTIERAGPPAVDGPQKDSFLKIRKQQGPGPFQARKKALAPRQVGPKGGCGVGTGRPPREGTAHLLEELRPAGKPPIEKKQAIAL
jgi:hypothetical protein